MRNTIILGAGPSGLGTAWQMALLKQGKVDIYEKSDRIGGVCGYYDFNGLRLDYGPHKIYSIIPGMMNAFKDLGGARLKETRKRHKIILRGRLLNYPVKLKQVFSVFGPVEVLSLGLSIFEAMIKHPFIKTPASYEDYCVRAFGGKLYDTVFRPLAGKIWGDPKALSADIAKTRIPTRNIYELIFKVLGLKKERRDTNAEFMFYPPRGFYDICECMADRIKRDGNLIHFGRWPSRFICSRNKIKYVIFNDMSRSEADLVVSSIPIKELALLLFPGDKEFLDKVRSIKMRDSVIVYFLINRQAVLKDHWIFCSDEDLLFSRISEQKLFSDKDFPGDRTVLSCDFTADRDGPVLKKREDEIIKECLGGLERLKIIKRGEVLDSRLVRISEFYPIYDIGYNKKIRSVFEKINRIENIICLGRLGTWSYNNIDHCLDMAIFSVRELAQGKLPPDINNRLLERARSYRIVD